ncbi:MAG: ATP-grasp domain-containing protein [Bdellovibrio sp.]|nr:ATP-grasp domain-containing protein [Bdellovibrio sp.]
MIGIIGGGQLALMLGDAAVQLGLDPLIFSGSKDDPAAQKHKAILGTLGEADAVREFFSKAKKVIFENEFVDCDRLEDLGKGTIEFLPSLSVIRLFQDKLEQKRALLRLGVDTAPFLELGLPQNISKDTLREVLSKLGGSCVLKWSRMGYDGKGVLFLTEAELDQPRVWDFLKNAGSKGALIYAEKKIPFKRELAIIGLNSISGDFLSYPLVVSEQTQGICSLVYGPATAAGVPESLQQKARTFAKKIAQSENLVGAFALEFFETQEGEILVNEIAPRVHNSGHYTQDAGMCDQFENHLRAVVGMPLGPVSSKGVFGMINLLGPQGLVRESMDGPFVRRWSEKVQLHWYGKKEISPFRKVGHLNAYDPTATASAPSQGSQQVLVRTLQSARDEWEKKLRAQPKFFRFDEEIK